MDILGIGILSIAIVSLIWFLYLMCKVMEIRRDFKTKRRVRNSDLQNKEAQAIRLSDEHVE